MPPWIASIIVSCGILGLFWLDRDRDAKPSPALWIPIAWLALACSRPISIWFDVGTSLSADQVSEGSPVDRLVYLVLIVVGLVVVATRQRRVATLLRLNGPVVLFFAYCAVSLLWSDYPDVAVKRLFKAIGDLVMILIVLSEQQPLVAVQRVLARVAYVLIPVSILFIKYYIELGRGYGPWGGAAVYTGVTTNKNTLGVVCLFLGLAALWRFLRTYREPKSFNRKRHLLAQCVVLAMTFWLLWVADSMTSLSTFAMAGTLLFVTSRPSATRRPALVHFLIATMLVASVSVLFLGASPTALNTLGRDPTLTDRTKIWAELLGLVTNPICGTGFESFWLGPRLEKMWSLYWWHPGQAHNGYLEIYLNLGWIGIALLGFVIVKSYRAAFEAWRRDATLGNLVLAFFLSGLIYNFTEAAFFRMLHPAWIFFLSAITAAPTIRGSVPVPTGTYMNVAISQTGEDQVSTWQKQVV